MGLFGASGLKSLGNSVAQTVAQLAGQAVNVASLAISDPTKWQFSLSGTSLVLNFNGGNALTFLSNGACTIPSSVTTGGFVWSKGGYFNNASGALMISQTAPTIVAGAGASIVASNGSAAFTANLGGAASTGTITLPAATTGWVVYMQNTTHPDANVMGQTGFTQTTATFTNYVRTTGVAGNWTANDVMACIAIAF